MSDIVAKLKFPELSFCEENHTYRLNGILIPGVSELMRPLSDSFYKWIDQTILDAAAKRGSEVHEAIENYILYGIEDCEPEHRPYFDAFLEWLRRYDVHVIAVEIPLYNRVYRYAGTADILCMIDGELVLVDVKTTAQVNHLLTDVQLVAYNAALASHGVRTAYKAVLHLKKNGKYSFQPMDKATDSKAWTTFGALMEVNSHIQRYKKG